MYTARVKGENIRCYERIWRLVRVNRSGHGWWEEISKMVLHKSERLKEYFSSRYAQEF